MKNQDLTEKEQKIQIRILKAFETQAFANGPKSVVMTQLATELGMSTKTLYRYFPNKTEMVVAIVEDWRDSMEEHRNTRIKKNQNAAERITEAILEWFNLNNRICDAFWPQVERDYPDAYVIFEQNRLAFLQTSRENLLPEIRKDLQPDIALLSLLTIINNMPNAEVCNEFNITRKDALIQTVDVWTKGALK